MDADDITFYGGYWIVVAPQMVEKGRVEHRGVPRSTVGDSITESRLSGTILYVHDHFDKALLMYHIKRAVYDVAQEQIRDTIASS